MAASLEGNKIIGAILTGAILAIGAGVVANIIYSPHVKLEHDAYQVDVSAVAEGGAPAPTEAAAPIADRLASADPAKGEASAKVCLSCHTFAQGEPNKVGPNLYNTVGEEIGKGKNGFAFSPALSGHGGEWTFDNLDHFLTSPKEFAPGTKMSFAGLAKPDQRANVIAYLRTLSSNPVPLPAPSAPAGQEPAKPAAPAGEEQKTPSPPTP